VASVVGAAVGADVGAGVGTGEGDGDGDEVGADDGVLLAEAKFLPESTKVVIVNDVIKLSNSSVSPVEAVSRSETGRVICVTAGKVQYPQVVVCNGCHVS